MALTGGDARLRSAVALLEHGAAQRLLITGVHPTTTKAELRVLSHGGARFDCCTDLGFEAANTRGNAEETARNGPRDHHYKSLIVVTASYHMPRSLTEFGAEMPDERLVPYPCRAVGCGPDRLVAQSARHLHLLHGEYAKYLASFIITRFENHTQPALVPAGSQCDRARSLGDRPEHPMLLIRSTLFFVWFAPSSTALAQLYLPALLLPRSAMRRGFALLVALRACCGTQRDRRSRLRGPRHAAKGRGADRSQAHEHVGHGGAVPDPLRSGRRAESRAAAHPVLRLVHLEGRVHRDRPRRQGLGDAQDGEGCAGRPGGAGRSVLIFPEGTRKQPGMPPDYKPGVAGLYSLLGVPCVPVALNSALFWTGPGGFEKKAGRVVVEFLEPIPPGLKRRDFLPELERRIEAATAALLAEGRTLLDGRNSR